MQLVGVVRQDSHALVEEIVKRAVLIIKKGDCSQRCYSTGGSTQSFHKGSIRKQPVLVFMLMSVFLVALVKKLLELEPLFVRPEAKIPILSIGACVPRDHDLLVCSVSIQYFPGVVRDLLSVKNEFSVVVTAAAEFFYLLILQIL